MLESSPHSGIRKIFMLVNFRDYTNIRKFCTTRRIVLSSNCRGQGLTFEFLDSQFGHAGAKSTGIESEDSCSSFVTLDSPARVFEYPDNVFLFHFFQSLI